MPRMQTREGEEIWETTTDGTVWVSVTDDRGREKQISVGGRAGQRLRLKTLDREVNQEAIFDEEADPFRNGLLRRVDADQNSDEATATDQAFSPEQLAKLFAKNGNSFRASVDKLNEVNVRRMRALADDLEVSTAQLSYLEEVIEAKFRKHGDTKTYREMQAFGDVTH